MVFSFSIFIIPVNNTYIDVFIFKYFTIVLINKNTLSPGDRCPVVLKLESPIIAADGDKFISKTEIKTTQDNSYPKFVHSHYSDWHNGYFIAVCEKSKEKNKWKMYQVGKLEEAVLIIEEKRKRKVT